MVRSLAQRARRDLGALLVDGFFKGTARAGKLLPLSHPRLHNVEVLKDIPYRDTGQREHLLDIYRPRAVKEGPEGAGRLPVVLYLHGGGFRILSKDSHWLFGLLYARRGYLVVNASYRLAPRHGWPSAHEDAFCAYEWVVRNAAQFGGDASQMVVAGESAGANLATALAVATSYPRPESWARRVFDLGLTPKAVVAASGLLQVTDPGRFSRDRPLPAFLQDRLDEVPEAYLGDTRDAALADPLCLLEDAQAPARPLPAFFAFCGTWDILLRDTERLAAALAKLKAPHQARYYERGIHGFHAFVFDRTARRAWRDTFAFLDRTLGAPPIPATRLFSR